MENRPDYIWVCLGIGIGATFKLIALYQMMSICYPFKYELCWFGEQAENATAKQISNL